MENISVGTARERLLVLLHQERSDAYRLTDYLHHKSEEEEEVVQLPPPAIDQERVGGVFMCDTPRSNKSCQRTTSTTPPRHLNYNTEASSTISNNDSSKASSEEEESKKRSRDAFCQAETIHCKRAVVLISGEAPNESPSNQCHFRPIGEEKTYQTALSFNGLGRQRVAEWLFGAIDVLGFPRQLACQAMMFFDLVVARTCKHHKGQDELRLLAVTCLFISIKIFSSDSYWCAKRMAHMSGNAFPPRSIVEEENNVLNLLHWRMNPPLPNDFLQFFFSVMESPCDELMDRAEYLVELSVLDSYFLAYRPSRIALAALANATIMVFPYVKEPYHFVERAFGDMLPVFDFVHHTECCRRLRSLYDSAMTENQVGKRTASPTSAAQFPGAQKYQAP